MAKNPVKGAGVRLGKTDALPSKPFDGAGKKGPTYAKMGGTANGRTAKSYPKGR